LEQAAARNVLGSVVKNSPFSASFAVNRNDVPIRDQSLLRRSQGLQKRRQLQLFLSGKFEKLPCRTLRLAVVQRNGLLDRAGATVVEVGG
jgi:hypothetical protein